MALTFFHCYIYRRNSCFHRWNCNLWALSHHPQRLCLVDRVKPKSSSSNCARSNPWRRSRWIHWTLPMLVRTQMQRRRLWRALLPISSSFSGLVVILSAFTQRKALGTKEFNTSFFYLMNKCVGHRISLVSVLHFTLISFRTCATTHPVLSMHSHHTYI